MWFFFRFITWEQRKLGEVANIQKGQQLGKAEMSNNGAFYVLNGGMEPSGYTNQYNTFANTISISEGGNSCGYVSLNLEQFWSGGHNYTLQNPRIDTFFLYQWLKRHEKGIMALRVGSGLPNIQKSALQDVIVAYPKKSEQRAIAEILNKIDNLITLHQREHRQKKNPFLNENRSLFREAIANAWEQRKAETLFITYAEKGYPELPVLSATQDKGMVFRDDTGKIIFHDKSNEIGYKRVQPGQFVIHLRSFQGGFAHSAILGITSPAYSIFGFKEGEKQSDLYWKYIFSSPEFIRRLETVTYGIRDGRSISYDEFLTMKFVIPKYEEQIKIAGYLSKVDNLITLHQRGLIKIQGDKNGKKRSFRRIVQRLF